MKLLVTLFIAYLIIVVVMAFGQRRIMYYPYTDLLSPSQYGLPAVEEVKLNTEDGETLVAWHLPAKEERPTILYFHGNGGHLAFRTDFFQVAEVAGYGVLMVSYRGYGTSTGSPTEQGFYMDASAAYNHLLQSVDEKNIILFGESLGTGVAVELARGKQVQALVLQAPFTSAAKLASEIYWWLPVQMLIKDRYDSISKVDEINVPVLVLAAENDRIVPAAHAKKLFEAMSEPKQYIEFEHIGHNDFNSHSIIEALDSF